MRFFFFKAGRLFSSWAARKKEYALLASATHRALFGYAVKPKTESAFKAASSSISLSDYLCQAFNRPRRAHARTHASTHTRARTHTHMHALLEKVVHVHMHTRSIKHLSPKTPESSHPASATPQCAVILEKGLFKIRGHKSQAQTEPLNGCCGCWDASAAQSKESFLDH